MQKRISKEVQVEFDNGRIMKQAIAFTKNHLTRIREEKRRALLKAPEGKLKT